MTINGRKVCGRPVKVFSRVVGYYSPVDNWNKGKKEEFKSRKMYKTSSVNSSLKNN